MPNTFDYEWDVEIVNEHGDIEDHHFQTSARDMLKHFNEQKPGTAQMVLVWSEGNDHDGVVDRAWAYLTPENALPEYFAKPNSRGVYEPIAHRVPKKYNKELRRAVA